MRIILSIFVLSISSTAFAQHVVNVSLFHLTLQNGVLNATQLCAGEIKYDQFDSDLPLVATCQKIGNPSLDIQLYGGSGATTENKSFSIAAVIDNQLYQM